MVRVDHISFWDTGAGPLHISDCVSVCSCVHVCVDMLMTLFYHMLIFHHLHVHAVGRKCMPTDQSNGHLHK